MSRKRWNQVPLTQFCRPKQWPTIPTRLFLDTGYPVFGANGQIGYYSEYNHKQPTVLITCRGATCGTINISEPFSYVTGNAMALDDLDTNQVDLKFLFYALRRNGLGKAITGTAQPQITRQSLFEVKIPLPPSSEQRRIAAILDKADAIRRKRQEALALTDEFLRSAFLEMFGDPVTNPKGWPVLSIGDIAPDKGLIVDGPFGSSLKPECYVESGIRVIRNFNIKDDAFDDQEFKYVTEGKFSEIRRSEVAQGDILISTKGTIGNICIMPEIPGPSVLSATGTVRVRPRDSSDINPGFLVSQMTNPIFKQYIKRFESGTNQKYLNLSGIRKMQIIVPPAKLQDQYCLIRAQIRKVTQHLRSASISSENFFNSLSQRAFCGKL